ncbi:hypothetical protein CMO89_03880 [Candidatus Woesearchaeota archaeon]|nr:hypothetical protein [Candidatus Woesearchaeota archaeon]|tara:strand:- start:5430 stop:6551 length:1122 start_codon:yes stop_codon:yes gene_type:complete
MQALAITSKGMEDIAALEIKELIKAESSVKESCVMFEPKKLEDLCTLCYKAQSVSRILVLFHHFKFKDKADLLKKINLEKIDYNKWLDKKNTFKIECERLGKHNFSSQEIEQEIGELISVKNKVELKNPDITFYAYIFDKELYFGIDFSGFELSKRHYKIFNHPNDIKGHIAYVLVRLSGFKVGDVLLDPFCKTGVIAIEAALFASGFPVNYFSKDKFGFLKLKPIKKFNFDTVDKKTKKIKKHIFGYEKSSFYTQSAKKNAKIAGVNDMAEFSSNDVEWVDTHFKEKEVNRIVTYPPILSKKSNKNEILKLYQELFYQANYCLAKDGRIVVLTKDIELFKEKAKGYKFKVVEERKVWIGEMVMDIVVFGKGL